ncbi:MAG: hypothetical protein NC305_08500 [Lachnospiraceae bacterium]|nr:hypothetical protein [Butyrivibrio sp.]MCM1343403.1 hypothetical protein [Muribaculaceae bacterium]MCM1410572.1 hypothetical protein [Lachnospiraceae bacterium]
MDMTDLGVLESVSEYKCKSPIVFIFFNRPHAMIKVLERIRQVRPDKLYLVADGPRNEEEKSKTGECRCIAQEMIDWDCQVVKVYAEKNMGCRNRVVSGISFVLQQEESAIILEDDCVPSISFFRFMDEMLERYKENDEVYYVAGRNEVGKHDEQNYDYYLSHHGGIWGWGTWERSWKIYDVDMVHWPEIRDKKGGHVREWMGWKEWVRKKRLNEDTYNGKINTWDFQMTFTMQYHRKTCIVPSVNLVQNIGVGPDATHTSMKVDKRFSLPAYEMNFPLRHPENIAVHNGYDRAYSREVFEKGFWRYLLLQIIKRGLKVLTGKEFGRKDFPLLFQK